MRERWLQTVVYRLRQVKQQLGFVAPLTSTDYIEVERWLPAQAVTLFRTMTTADQQHSLRVCRRLQERGCTEQELLAAALLHDVGKAQGRVPFWTRPAIVLGKRWNPDLLQRCIVELERLQEPQLASWKRALGYAWWHAEVGAELATSAGLSARTTLYIRTHHHAHGPAALLHEVDEVS